MIWRVYLADLAAEKSGQAGRFPQYLREGYWFAPVGVKDFGNSTVLVGQDEATITGFLSQQTDDARAILVENKHRHGEAEVLEVLTDAEEVSGEVIVKEGVIDCRLDLRGGFGGAVLQPQTIADLGFEILVGCQSLVFSGLEVWKRLDGAKV